MIGDFPMHQQRDTLCRHLGDRRIGFLDVGHTRIGIGGRARRIELHGFNKARCFRLGNFFGQRGIRQIQGHQWLKVRACRPRRQNPFPIRLRRCDGRHRRPQIRHDDRPCKLSRDMRHRHRQRSPIAQVNMPVIGLTKHEFIHHSSHGNTLESNVSQ